MRLRWNSSWRPGKVEVFLNPEDEIVVPDETGRGLLRTYEGRFIEVTSKTPKVKGPSALERAKTEGQEVAEQAAVAQEKADAEATAPPEAKPRRRSRSSKQRTTPKRSRPPAASSGTEATAPPEAEPEPDPAPATAAAE